MHPKKSLSVFLILFVNIIYAQVGIGTTSPNATLDIRSSNQATPANDDGILIPKVDAFPAVNPTAAQQGMLVYLTTVSGANPPGFYFWDNGTTSWTKIASGADGDKDWYEEGTTTSPDAITDDMFHTGNVAIGKNTADYPLEVNTATHEKGIVNTFSSTATSAAEKYALQNELTIDSDEEITSLKTNITGTGDGAQYGAYSTLAGTGTGNHIGAYHRLTGTGTGSQYGVYNHIFNTGIGNHLGVTNLLSGNGNGIQYGVMTSINNTGSGEQYGVYNLIGNSGIGNHYGIYNSLFGTGTGTQYASYNTITSTSNNPLYGTFSFIPGTGSGEHHGARNVLSGSGSGFQYGTTNEIVNTGSGNHYGNFNSLSGVGLGTKYGTYSSLSGTGDGIQCGSCASITNTGDEDHYGSDFFANGTGTGNHYGYSAYITGAGSGWQYGSSLSIDNSGNGQHFGTVNRLGGGGTGEHYATKNLIIGTGSGIQYGVHNEISNSGAGIHYGNYTNLLGTGTGDQYGNYTTITNTGMNNQYGSYTVLSSNAFGGHTGNYNLLSGGSGGVQTGTYNEITNTAGSSHYGSVSSLSGTGAATKYGFYADLNAAAGGTHYGVYSSVLKAGATNFAGYFLGNVGIGTTTLNTYTLPPSRGTNNQIMQTNATGVVTWQDPSSFAWSLSGNNTVAANFIGTTNAQAFRFYCNNVERFRINPADGEIVAGATISPYAGDMLSAVSTATLTFATNGYSAQNGSGVWGEIMAASTTAFSAVQGVYGGSGNGAGVLGNYNGTNTAVLRAGVSGICSTAAANNGGVGVYGYNAIASGNQRMGVYGSYNASAFGLGVVGIAFGGSLITGNNDIAVVGWRANNANYSGYFNGNHVIVNGTKSASVGTSKGNQLLYVTESPGVWFEDIGGGQLINGQAHIEIDPLFMETIFVDANHPMRIFLQEEGESNGLIVIKDADNKGFTVKEKNGGTSSIAFSYRLMAKRLHFQDHRFGNDQVWGEGDTRKYNQYATPPPIDYNENVRFQEEQKRNYKPTPMPKGFIDYMTLQKEGQKSALTRPDKDKE